MLEIYSPIIEFNNTIFPELSYMWHFEKILLRLFTYLSLCAAAKCAYL